MHHPAARWQEDSTGRQVCRGRTGCGIEGRWGRFRLPDGRRNGEKSFRHLENEAEAAVVVAGAGDAEGADLAGGFHVRAETGAHVVVADAYDAEGFAGAVGQLGECDAGGDVVAGHELVGDGQVGLYEGVDAALDVGHLLLGERPVEEEVDLALLAFDVRVAAPFAAIQPHHGLVEQVFGRVRGRELLFVVGVEYRGVLGIIVLGVFHLENFCKSSNFLWEKCYFCRLNRYLTKNNQKIEK